MRKKQKNQMKNTHVLHNQSTMFNFSAEDEDDEGSGDEIYNRTTTIINENAPGPSKAPVEHITGIDNRGLDDDFNSVFEQISINVANRQNFI